METGQPVDIRSVRERMEGAKPSGSKRTAASRVLSLLGAFSRGGGSLTLSEISRHADLSLTTTHRLAKEVMEWGGLELDASGHYRLSGKILDLASTSTRALHIREAAVPHLIDLHHRTGLTVNLSVRDGHDVMYLDTLRAHPNYTGESRIGGRLRMHVTATGLVVLAFAAEEVLRDYLSEPLKRYTPHTIADETQLREFLEDVRQNGHATAHKFVTMRAGSVAAPVIDTDGRVDTAVGIVYRTERHDPRRLAAQARITAQRISQTLQRDGCGALDPRTVDFNRRDAGLV